MLSVDEAARLRALVASWFAERGREVSLASGHVETDDGFRYGLWNLAARCHDDEAGPVGWPGLVDEHFTVLLAAQDTDLEAFSDEEYADLLRLRLVEDQDVPGMAEDPGVPVEWAPGIRRIVVLDLPTTVVTPPRSQFERRGPVGPQLDRAWRQTASLVVTEDLERLPVEKDGRRVWCVLGDSVFTASLALFLPDLVRRFEPGADLTHGILFSLPHRHQVNYRVVGDPQGALAGLLVLPEFTVLGFLDAQSPVSPSVYLWLNGEVTRISSFEDNAIHVRPGPFLEDLLDQLEG